MWAKVDGSFLHLKEDRRLVYSLIFQLFDLSAPHNTFVDLAGNETVLAHFRRSICTDYCQTGRQHIRNDLYQP